MKRALLILACLMSASGIARGHGLPIIINAGSGQLAVSGGLTLTEGFARLSFDHSEDSYAEIGFGNTQAWTTPGFEPHGAAVGLPIDLQVLSRPDFSAAPLIQRWLWFWNPTTAEIELADHDPFLAINPQDLSTPMSFTQFAGPGGDETIEVPVNAGLGHHPLEFALDDLPAAAPGVYGFFARLKSPGLEPSEPILIALNYNQSVEDFIEGTKQINRAAGIRGDYDYDLVVDGDDFLSWQRTLGAVGPLPADGSLNRVVDAADLALWKTRFGDRLILDDAVVAVPEPSGLILLALAGARLVGRARLR